jgi:serine/threonine protein kinase
VIGQKINNYEVRSLLGEGGMGSVYVAEHPVLGRRAAVKVLRKEYAVDANLVGRFINEARASSAIKHPGIIEVFDVGTLAEGVPYLMMELLEGETLGRRIDREGRLKVPDAVDIAAQAASALAAANGHGIVHRDLKPENLFLIPDPSQRSHVRVKVLDFGIAKLQRRLSGQSIRTHTGSIMGTPPYMSPEQCRGISSEIDQRTDVYALGIILYEMLTGTPPFLSEGFGDVLLMHLTQPPRPPREIEPSVPHSLEQLVLHALEKEPERRLASMEELLRGLLGPAARTTVRHGEAAADPQYAETDVIPRLRAGSSSARRTTFSSTASQLMEDTERVSVRRRRMAVGAVVAVAVAVAGIAALTGGRTDAPPVEPVSVARPPGSKLSAGAVQATAPATDPVAPAVVPAPAPGPASQATPPPAAPSPPPAVPPRATAEADLAPAADPPTPTLRRPGAGKPTRGRARKISAQGAAGTQAAPATGVRPGDALRAPVVSEFAPLPDKPAGPATAPAPPATTPAPAAGPPRAAHPSANQPAKPRLSTDKW